MTAVIRFCFRDKHHYSFLFLWSDVFFFRMLNYQESNFKIFSQLERSQLARIEQCMIVGVVSFSLCLGISSHETPSYVSSCGYSFTILFHISCIYIACEVSTGAVNDCVSGTFLTLSQAFIPASRKRPPYYPSYQLGRENTGYLI